MQIVRQQNRRIDRVELSVAGGPSQAEAAFR